MTSFSTGSVSFTSAYHATNSILSTATISVSSMSEISTPTTLARTKSASSLISLVSGATATLSFTSLVRGTSDTRIYPVWSVERPSVSQPKARPSSQGLTTSPAISQKMASISFFSSSTSNSGPGQSPSQTRPVSSTPSDTTSIFPSSSIPPPSHISPSDLPSTSRSMTSVVSTSPPHSISIVTVSPSQTPASSSDPTTITHAESPLTSMAMPATPLSITITTEAVSVKTVPTIIITVLSSSVQSGNVVTETSIIPSPTLSADPGSDNGSHILTNKGAVAAVSVVVGLLAISMAVWVFLAYYRRRKKILMERESTMAAMAAADITRVAPLEEEDDNEGPLPSQCRQSFFEDGTLVTNAVDQDFRGPFNPYLVYSDFVPRGGESPALHGSELVGSPAVPSPAGYMNGNTPSSHGHGSYSAHEPLLTSESSRAHLLSGNPLFNGTLQRLDMSRPNASEENGAPPRQPPRILTTYAPSQYLSVQQDSPESDCAQHDDDEANGLSPLDPHLGERLREGDGSKGSVGLHDNEDYSARLKLEVRNKTGSQRTFGSETSKTH